MKTKSSDEILRCSFCHKSQDAVAKLISSPSDYPRAYICDECVAVCNSILEDDRTATPASAPPNQLPKPQEVKTFLDEYVIGQEQTKKKLAVAVYNHYKRIFMVCSCPMTYSSRKVLTSCGLGSWLGGAEAGVAVRSSSRIELQTATHSSQM